MIPSSIAKYKFLISEQLANKQHLESQLLNTQHKMDEVLQEQVLLEKTTLALQQARPLLSASSIKQCEQLANAAISSIFNFPYTVEYNIETQRFILNKGDYTTDLADAEGGGICTVVSAVFDMFLLAKTGCRRLLVYDEAWYAVSSEYFDNFISFMRQSCKELGIDILLVSHDDRLTLDMVDRAYRIDKGHSQRIK